MKYPLLSSLLVAMTTLVSAADDKPAKIATAYVGGGCFWCTEGAYKVVPGILKVVSGYAGGTKPNPTYEDICTGDSGHAEVVKVEFDPSKVT